MSKKKETKEEIKILYVWIKEYKCISKQGFNLDSQYIFDYNHENNTLSVKENKNYIEDFFSLKKNEISKISNITAIVGKNGSGKSTLIESLIDIFLTKNFSKKLIIYSITTNNKEKIYYCSNSPNNPLLDNINLKINSKEVHYKQLDSELIPKIIYVDQLYTNSSNYSKFYADNPNLINISQNYLLNNDGDESFFLDQKAQHYNKDIIRQINFILSSKNINLFDLPTHMEISLRHITHLVEDSFSKITKNLQSINTKDETLLKNTLESIKSLNYSYIDLFNKVNIEIQYIYINKSSSTNVKKLFVFQIYINILSKNIIEFQNIDRNELEKDLQILYKKVEKIQLYLNKLIGLQDNDNLLNELKSTEIVGGNEILKNFIENILSKKSFTSDSLSLSISLEEMRVLLESYFYKLSSLHDFFIFNWSKALIENKSNIIKLSSGEYTSLSFFSRLFSIFNEKDLFYKKDSSKENRNFILLIDECELALHPEWQRKFIYNLINFIESLPKNYNFQIVITSHSPFIVSDLPDENIIIMKNKNQSKEIVDSNFIDHKTFASNISKLFENNFFLENTMGYFAFDKITNIIKELESSKKTITKVKYERLKKIIEKIGEPFIRKKLLYMLESKKIRVSKG